MSCLDGMAAEEQPASGSGTASSELLSESSEITVGAVRLASRRVLPTIGIVAGGPVEAARRASLRVLAMVRVSAGALVGRWEPPRVLAIVRDLGFLLCDFDFRFPLSNVPSILCYVNQ